METYQTKFEGLIRKLYHDRDQTLDPLQDLQNNYIKLVGTEDPIIRDKILTIHNNYGARIARLQERHKGFRELMELDDEQLRIQNSNQRVNFSEDSVYEKTESDPLRLGLKNRKITESEYFGTLFPIQKAKEVEDKEKYIARRMRIISRFYDDPDKALELLRQNSGLFVYNIPSNERDIDSFGMKQLEMHEKRKRTGTPHSLAILETHLEVLSDRSESNARFKDIASSLNPEFTHPGTQNVDYGRRVPPRPNLDQIERGMFGYESSTRHPRH